MGNIVSKSGDQLCRALSHRTDPEKLKEMGNEELGEPDKAINYLKQSPMDSVNADVSRAQSVKGRIAKCGDARKVRDWITVLQESQAAVSDGADCAPQVMALQAEALLKLQRHEEADSALRGAPRFGVDESTKFFGTTAHAYVLMLERWEASLRDYQVLIQELPENEDVKKALAEVEAKLKSQRN
ncbi:unnamed protein product [Triticum turgidum subsp. durum]|uniref:Uncharacterized protein n=1 Tax=Triticum turgidum subsp. durum TaxID=4567 RepID=A0A9R0YTA3_TRITD|nr:unnamed protein product [Triticum turgidum subsp. durum]